MPSPRLAERPEGATLPAVGDWVALTDDEDTDDPVIVAILPRTSEISRRDPADVTQQQVLAANVDHVFVIHGMDRELNLRRIERSLAVGFDSGAQPVVVLTKCDLVDDPDAAVREVRGAAADVDVVATSATTGEGLDALAGYLADHGTVALLGASGAGKSTLVNRLVGEEVMETTEVRDGDAKGRHTTVTRQLIVLPQGGLVVDTPGLRGLGLWDAEVGVDLAFPDVVELAAACRFRDCAHEAEPGCAVKAAIAAGDLEARRLDSYQRLVRELEDLTRRQAEQEWQRSERKPGQQRTGRRTTGRGRKGPKRR